MKNIKKPKSKMKKLALTLALAQVFSIASSLPVSNVAGLNGNAVYAAEPQQKHVWKKYKNETGIISGWKEFNESGQTSVVTGDRRADDESGLQHLIGTWVAIHNDSNREYDIKIHVTRARYVVRNESIEGRQTYIEYTFDKVQRLIEEQEDFKGSYIENVESTDSNAYPKDGKQGDYWYEYVWNKEPEGTYVWGKYNVDSKQIVTYRQTGESGTFETEDQFFWITGRWVKHGYDNNKEVYISNVKRATRHRRVSGGEFEYYDIGIVTYSDTRYKTTTQKDFKGSYIEDVKSSNSSEYPDNNKKNNYWYVYKGTVKQSETFTPQIEKVTVGWGKTLDLTPAIKNLPDTAKVEEITNPKVDTKVSGDHKAKAKITFSDGSTKEVEIPVTVSKSAAEGFEPTLKTYKVKKGEPCDIKDAITNLPDGATSKVKTPVDTSMIGKRFGTLEVKFADGSTKEVQVPVEIVNLQADDFAPELNDVKTPWGKPVDITGAVKNLPDGAKLEDITTPAINTKESGNHEAKGKITFPDGSTKEVTIPVVVEKSAAEGFKPTFNDVKTPWGKKVDITGAVSNLPDGAKLEDITDPKIDTKVSGNHEAKGKITFADGSTKEIAIPVVVEKSAAEGFEPTFNDVKVPWGKPVDITGAVSNLPDGAKLEDVTDPKIDTKVSGNHEAKGKITFPDGSTKEVTIPVVVEPSAAEGFKPVLKDNIVAIKDKPCNIEDAITNLPEGATVKEKTPVDTSTTGEKTGVVTVTFADGSTKDVEVPVKVRGSLDAAIIDGKLIDTIKEEVVMKGGKIDLTDNIHAEGVVKVEDITNPAIDTNVPGQKVGKVKITFDNGDIVEAEVPVIVLEDAKALRAEIEKLKGQLDAANAKNSELEAKVKELEAKIAELEAQATKDKADIKALQDEKAALEEQAAKDKAEIEGLKNQIKTLNDSISEKDKTIADQKEQLANLTDKADALTVANGKLTKDLEDANNKIKALETENQGLKDQLADKDKKISELEGQIGKLNELVKELQDKIDGLNGSLDDANKKIADSKAELEKLQKELDAKIKELDAQIAQKEQEGKDLQKQLDDEKAKGNADQAKIDELNKAIEKNKADEKALQDEKAGLQKQLEEKEAAIQKLQEEAKALKDNITKLEDQIKDLLNDKNLSKDEVDKLKKDLADAQAKVKELEGQVANQNALIKELQDKLAKMEEALAKANEDLTNSKKELEEAKKALQTKIDELNNQIANKEKEGQDLQKQLDEEKAKGTVDQDKIKELEDKINANKDEEKALQDKKQSLENELAEKEAKIKELEEKAAGLEKDVNDLREKIKELIDGKAITESDAQKIKDELNKKIAELEKQLADKTNEANTINEKAKDLDKQVKDKDTKVKELEDELSKLKEDNKKQAEEGTKKDDKIKTLENNIIYLQRELRYSGSDDSSLIRDRDSIKKELDETKAALEKLKKESANKVDRQFADTSVLRYIFRIDSNIVSKVLKNKTVNFVMDVKPFISNNKTMLPLRYVAYTLDCEVEWNDATRTAVFKKDGISASIQVDGNKIVMSDGRVIYMQASPAFRNNRIFVPLTDISKVFGVTNGNTTDGVNQVIEWDHSSRTVSIYRDR